MRERLLRVGDSESSVDIGELDANDDTDDLRLLKCLDNAERLFDCSIAQSM